MTLFKYGPAVRFLWLTIQVADGCFEHVEFMCLRVHKTPQLGVVDEVENAFSGVVAGVRGRHLRPKLKGICGEIYSHSRMQ